MPTSCGTGGWNGPLPGDPGTNSILSATPAFGGIDVSWTYPATNPQAVAHTLLFRSLSSDFNTAMQIAVVAGNFYYDKNVLAIPPRYYYWIRIISINGTVGELIGPASAIAMGTIAEVIAGLSGQINAGHLAQTLMTEIDRINTNQQELIDEVTARLAANTALTTALAQVQTGVAEAITVISNEIIERQDGESAMVESINLIAAANGGSLAAILTDYYTKVEADSAIATALTDYVSMSGFSTALNDYASKAFLTINHFTKTETNSAISSATSSLVSTTALTTALGAYATDAEVAAALVSYVPTATLTTNYYTKTSVDGAISAAVVNLVSSATLTTTLGSYTNTATMNSNMRAKIGYAAKTGTSIPYDGNGSTIVYPVGTYPSATYPEYASDRTKIIDSVGVTNWNALGGISLTWLYGLPLATAIQTAQVTGPDGSIASVQTAFIAQKDLNNQFKAQYTAKVDVNGLVGGFGIYNDGVVVEAGFNVNKFWVGTSSANAVYPFIISGGVTYIKEAAIEKLTFTKLRDESGSVIVEGGKLKAAYIETKGLEIKDLLGNVIFSSGSALDWSRVGGANRPANNADVTSANTAAGIAGQGAFATLNQINAGNVGTYIAAAAIDNARIGTAAVDTLKIGGNAVTVSSYASETLGSTTITADVNTHCCTAYVTLSGLGAGTAGTIISGFMTLYEGGGSSATVETLLTVGGLIVATSACTLGESKTNAITHYVALGNGTHTISLYVRTNTGAGGAYSKTVQVKSGLIIMSGKR